MGKRFKIACHLIQWRGEQNEDPKKVLRAVAAAGYDGAEGLKPETPEQLVELACMAAQLGLKLVNVGAPTPEDRIRFNAALGNDAAEVKAVRRADFGGQSPTEEDYKRAAESLTSLCELASSLRVKPFHHAHLGTMIETPRDAEMMLKYAPHLYLLFDTGHMLAANSNPMDAIKTCSDRIAHVHLKDTTAKDPATWDRWTGKFNEDAWFDELGQGNLGLDVAAILNALDEAGYDGWISVEQDRPTAHDPYETAKVNRDYLRGLGY